MAAAAVILAGCNTVGAVINPVIGSWHAAVAGVGNDNVYHSDGTCTETTTILGVGVTKNGTWVSDSAAITRTWSDGVSDVRTYSFNSDKIADAQVDYRNEFIG
jgi:hypothetical protein